MHKKILLGLSVSMILLGAGCALPRQDRKNGLPATSNQTPQVDTNVIETSYPQNFGPMDSPLVDPTSSYFSVGQIKAIPSFHLFVTSTDLIDYYEHDYNIGPIEYKGKKVDLILVELGGNFPGGGGGTYFLVKDNNKYILLEKESSDKSFDSYIDKRIVTIDESTELPDLHLPATIVGHAPRQILELKIKQNIGVGTQLLTPAFKDKKYGQVFANPENDGYYISRGPFVGVYSLKVDFYDKDNLVPQITFSDGKKNKAEYSYTTVGGCGSHDFENVVSAKDVNVKTDLVKVGTNIMNDPIYELKDNNHKILKDLYSSSYIVLSGSPVTTTYEKFIAERPLLYWVDPFGKLVQLQNIKFGPMAECGKPVIYLYPEKPTKVSVSLHPEGGFTYTQPEYDDGWKVWAEPSGQLTELKTGKQYPYLFWEGRGGFYETPKKGFVVKKEEVENFLVKKLAELGLNQKETADFMQFWLPRMQEKPYYFITFMGNGVMDRLAPLSVLPKPDTTIRILMDFTPLEEPISVENFSIRTPERKGFTVVEWGGVLR